MSEHRQHPPPPSRSPHLPKVCKYPQVMALLYGAATGRGVCVRERITAVLECLRFRARVAPLPSDMLSARQLYSSSPSFYISNGFLSAPFEIASICCSRGASSGRGGSRKRGVAAELFLCWRRQTAATACAAICSSRAVKLPRSRIREFLFIFFDLQKPAGTFCSKSKPFTFFYYLFCVSGF